MSDPEFHRRRSIRLKNYDYSQAGAYFITVCVQGKLCLFGDIVNGNMIKNLGGEMIQSIWSAIPAHYPRVAVDAFVVMPNHFHGIIILTTDSVGAGPRACPKSDGQPRGVAPTRENNHRAPKGMASTSMVALPRIVHHFKSFSTAVYRKAVLAHDWPPFAGRLWQRNYYEHVIRNETDLFAIRQYIDENPLRWTLDRENPLLTER